MTFNGFISYSHAADGRLAPAVQRGLHRLAKPWHRRRALWIFRDQTGLAVTPALWSSIQGALDGSDYFVLMASPEAARSAWVNREIEHWIATKPANRILPVVTDGQWQWDRERRDFTEDSTAVPAALRGAFAEEPLFLDLRWARGNEHLSLQHSRFRDAIAQLAAPMHGVSKDELEGEDVRQHRRMRRLRSGAVSTLVVLAVLATATGVSAMRNAERANASAAEALRQQRAAAEQRGSAERFADESRRQQEQARIQRDLALRQQARAADATAEADRQEGLARVQQRLADEAAAEARQQQALAARAAKRTQEQRRLAQQASERARELEEKAERLAKAAEEQRRLAEEQRRQAEEQRRLAEEQGRLADEQQQLAEAAAAEAGRQQAAAELQQRIAVSRRLVNQARASVGTDPKTALMLGAAAQAVQADAGTRSRIAGLVASTRYAGTIPNVLSGAYAPDGVLAAVDSAGNVALWNVADRSHPRRIATVGPAVTSDPTLTFSPDGHTLAVVDPTGAAGLWDVTDRSAPVRRATLRSTGRVRSVTFSPDSGTVVTGDESGYTVLWDDADGTRLAQFGEPNTVRPSVVSDVAFSADGDTLMVDGYPNVLVYDVTDRTDPVQVSGRYAPDMGALAVSPTRPLAAGGRGGNVVLFDMTDPAEMAEHKVLTGVAGMVQSLAFSRDGRYLAAGGGTTVKVWDVSDPNWPRLVTSVDTVGVDAAVAFHPLDGTLLSTDRSATGSFWAVQPYGAPDLLSTVSVPGGYVEAMTLRRDGRSMAVGASRGTVSTWRVTDPARPVRDGALALPGTQFSVVAVSPDHRRVGAVDDKGRVTVTDRTHPARPVTLAASPEATGLAFSPDGRTLAVVDEETVTLWDLSVENRPVLRATLSGAEFRSTMLFSPDGRTLATSATDRTITLWDVADRSAPGRLATLTGHGAAVDALAFSADGRILASGGRDATVLLWDVADRAGPHRLAALPHGGMVTSVAFSPDGRTVALGLWDMAVMQWDITDRADPIPLATMGTVGFGGGNFVQYRRDGRTLAVGGIQTVSFWDNAGLDSLRTDPARHACAIAGRGLTAGEWARLVPEIPYRRTC